MSENTSILPTDGSLGSSSSSSPSQEISCDQLADKFNEARVLLSVIILGLINVMVIAGNVLVIVSVFSTTKLRTVTNFFIAVADLLVGIAVLPYSLTLEILDVWIFGEIWCKAWLAVDIWMCTASILNLCAISVDRYLAVTRPVRYRSIMTSKRAKLMIGVVWVLSFIICFPPLVGWNNDMASVFMQGGSESTSNVAKLHIPLSTTLPSSIDEENNILLSSISDDSETTTLFDDLSSILVEESEGRKSASSVNTQDTNAGDYIRINSNNSSLSETNGTNSTLLTLNAHCEYQVTKCALFNNRGYVIYSALGSFYIPMFLMLIFYWRIYMVASKTSRALKRGYKTTKSTNKSINGSQEERVTLRIHRGYVLGDELQAGGSGCSVGHYSEGSGAAGGSGSSCAGSTSTTSFTCNTNASKSRTGIIRQTFNEHDDDQQHTYQQQLLQQSTSKCTNKKHNTKKRQMPITLYKSTRNTNLTPNYKQQNGARRMSPSNQSTLSLPSTNSNCSSREGSSRSAKLAMTRMSKRTSKYQAKRFHAETKAAKTVGIIVGGFILCWLPFFTVYLARALICENSDCIPELLFSIFTWLGYCNSMINPCIYGLFSKDFRRAFKNILCRCKFSEENNVSSLIRQIHMPTFFEDNLDNPEDTVKTESQED